MKELIFRVCMWIALDLYGHCYLYSDREIGDLKLAAIKLYCKGLVAKGMGCCAFR